MSTDRRTQSERSAATRQALVDAGRELFGRLGYGSVSTSAIADAAGVSRGALYHQFVDKQALFVAVFEAVEAELVRVIGTAVATSGSRDPLESLAVGSLAWLDASAAPDVRRIALLDAPAVLGWERWREIEIEHTIGLVENVLTVAVESGRIRAQPVRPLALVLVGALDEAAQYLAKVGPSAPDVTAVRGVVQQLIAGLAVPDTASE